MLVCLLLLNAASSALYEEPAGGCQGPVDEVVPDLSQLYEEPPGGCQGPHPDDIPLPSRRIEPSSQPSTDNGPAVEESAEELERQLYETEAAEMMQAPEEDWVGPCSVK